MMSQHKLLLISAVFPPHRAGGADYAMRLATEVADRGVNVGVVTTAGARLPEGSNFSLFPIMDGWRWRHLAKLLEHISKMQPTVIDLHFTGWAYADHPMITLLPAFTARRFPSIRFVTHIEFIRGIDRARAHLPSLAVRRLITQLYGREKIDYEYGYLLRDSQSVIVLGEWEKAELVAHGVDEKKIVVTPPGPIMPIASTPSSDIKKSTRASVGFTSEDFVVAYYGYIFPGKGIETLIEAIEVASKSIPSIKLVMVGGAPEDSVLVNSGDGDYLTTLKNKCASLGISKRVVWTGYTGSKSEQASSYLRMSDVCVLPFDTGARLHRSSLSFAAAHELPIVSTWPHHLEAAFKNEQNIFLCEPKNAQEIAQALVRVFTNEECKRTLSAGAALLAEEYYSWSSTLEKTMKAYGFASNIGGST